MSTLSVSRSEHVSNEVVSGLILSYLMIFDSLDYILGMALNVLNVTATLSQATGSMVSPTPCSHGLCMI